MWRWIWRELGRWRRAWWDADRIRVSGHEGRLLRLPLPCIATIEGRPVEFVRRVTGRRNAGPYVRYEGRTVRGDCSLTVVPLAGAAVRLSWCDGGDEREISQAACEVYGGVAPNRGVDFTPTPQGSSMR